MGPELEPVSWVTLTLIKSILALVEANASFFIHAQSIASEDLYHVYGGNSTLVLTSEDLHK